MRGKVRCAACVPLLLLLLLPLTFLNLCRGSDVDAGSSSTDFIAEEEDDQPGPPSSNSGASRRILWNNPPPSCNRCPRPFRYSSYHCPVQSQRLLAAQAIRALWRAGYTTSAMHLLRSGVLLGLKKPAAFLAPTDRAWAGITHQNQTFHTLIKYHTLKHFRSYHKFRRQAPRTYLTLLRKKLLKTRLYGERGQFLAFKSVNGTGKRRAFVVKKDLFCNSLVIIQGVSAVLLPGRRRPAPPTYPPPPPVYPPPPPPAGLAPTSLAPTASGPAPQIGLPPVALPPSSLGPDIAVPPFSPSSVAPAPQITIPGAALLPASLAPAPAGGLPPSVGAAPASLGPAAAPTIVAPLVGGPTTGFTPSPIAVVPI